MKRLLAILVFTFAAGTVSAQTDNNNRSRAPGPVVASPFQALGNVIRNPDADPPRRPQQPSTQPPPPPSFIPPGTLDNGARANPGR